MFVIISLKTCYISLFIHPTCITELKKNYYIIILSFIRCLFDSRNMKSHKKQAVAIRNLVFRAVNFIVQIHLSRSNKMMIFSLRGEERKSLPCSLILMLVNELIFFFSGKARERMPQLRKHMPFCSAL